MYEVMAVGIDRLVRVKNIVFELGYLTQLSHTSWGIIQRLCTSGNQILFENLKHDRLLLVPLLEDIKLNFIRLFNNLYI